MNLKNIYISSVRILENSPFTPSQQSTFFNLLANTFAKCISKFQKSHFLTKTEKKRKDQQFSSIEFSDKKILASFIKKFLLLDFYKTDYYINIILNIEKNGQTSKTSFYEKMIDPSRAEHN
jgi:hypothetical protein